jgi:hypothetical protein
MEIKTAKTVKILNIFGETLGEWPGETIKEALINASASRANLWEADLRGANLWEANLWGADLRGANLRGANLRGANLWGANLWGANLWGANLWEANLRGANLRGANLRGANLRGANLPSPGVILTAYWGECSDATTLALMRLDASAHPDPKAFDRWANGSGRCPYSDMVIKVERAANFYQKAQLWAPGPPPTLWEALCMVLDEKCPGWRGEPK